MSYTASSIRTGLETLPQELYDIIYEDVFTAPPGVRNINSSSTLLSMKLLHISRDSRALYAKTFYDAEFEYATDLKTFTRWVSLMPESHRNRTQKISKGGDHLDPWRIMLKLYPNLDSVRSGSSLTPLEDNTMGLCAFFFYHHMSIVAGKETASKAFLLHRETRYILVDGEMRQEAAAKVSSP